MDNLYPQANREPEVAARLNRIHELAGQVGEAFDSMPGAPDAENYEYQVHMGMAEAVLHVLNYDPSVLCYWFGYCFIQLGIDCDEGINEALDYMGKMVSNRLEEDSWSARSSD